MSDVLADTHSIIWFLAEPSKLSTAASTAMAEAERTGTIFVSAMTPVEMTYLIEKPNFPYPGILARLYGLLDDPAEPLETLPVTLDVAKAMNQVKRDEIPDMPDRVIAATAVAHSLQLVSVDSDIRNSQSLKALVTVIW